MLRQCVDSLSDRAPFKWFQSQEAFQFLMLGRANAGKTALLYKLKINGLKKAEIKLALKNLKSDSSGGIADSRDPAYHYEEFRSSILGQYAIWEVPGNEAMVRLWPMFYRYLRFNAVIFVVDAFSKEAEDLDKLAQAREMLHYLLNEDELRCAAFFLILNVEEKEGKKESTSEEENFSEREDAFFKMLGVSEIQQQKPHKIRFKKFAFNCTEIDRDGKVWESLLKEAAKIHNLIGGGGGAV